MSETLDERRSRYGPLVVDEMRDIVGDSPAGLFSWMRYHLGWEERDGAAVDARGGKLLRPLALLVAAEITGDAVEQAVPAAAAVELVHNFSLLHDDIEDESASRHGRATVWTFAGRAQAINTGDGMFTLARLAMHRLLDRRVEQRRVIEAIRELDEACLRLVEGQYLDLLFESRAAVSRDEYLTMAGGKTAAMFAAPFAIGALLGGADGQTVSAFREFGRRVGLAYQAIDDVLGIWGDPAVTGKPASDDLRARKMTLPVIAALESGGDEAETFARGYASPDDSDQHLAMLTGLIERLEGRAAAEQFAADQVREALAGLAAAGVDRDALALCKGFTDVAAGRDF
ncbi:MAG: polyprenyl synthetase family protein [Dehalococcoidia bacterium]